MAECLEAAGFRNRCCQGLAMPAGGRTLLVRSRIYHPDHYEAEELRFLLRRCPRLVVFNDFYLGL